MRPLASLAACALAAGLAPPAMAWEEPARGTELRQALMDAIRPAVERDLGAPVLFVVRDLRVDGDVGFGSLEPVRPDGRPIRFEDTPLARTGVEAEEIDGFAVHTLYRRAEGAWQVADFSIGATDVWWMAPEICAVWQPVLPEFCA